MKKKSSLIKITISVASMAAMLSGVAAQTVLSGDHVVEGNLEVGDAIQKGGLTINGETGNTASPGIRVTGDGGVVFEGTNGVGTIPTEGPGVRMMWYPKKAAFRAGRMSWGGWNDSSIGTSSVAFGESVAYGSYSTAMGEGEAYGSYSTAISGGTVIGNHSTVISGGFAEGDYSAGLSGGGAYGDYSTAMSAGYAWKDYSIAMSGGFAIGDFSTAMSKGEAGGDHSTAMSGGYAGGGYSTAMSEGYSVGDYSTAMSYGEASGENSIAGGYAIMSTAYRSVAFGSYNDITGNESTSEWVDTDPIFTIGNGTGSPSDPPEVKRRNAFVILKNGDIQIPKRQGDILMGEFGNPEP